MPMPRFWYFPRGEKAVVVMTGDDHTASGTDAHFTASVRSGPPSCSVADWDCMRSTSYVYRDQRHDPRAGARRTRPRGSRSRCTSTPGCQRLHERLAARDLGRPAAQFLTALARPGGGAAHQPQPLHRLERLGELSQVEREFGVRLDTNYYYWPGSWVQDRPGMFTGSGFPHAVRRPRRLADRRLPGDDADHRRVGDRTSPSTSPALLDKALGAPGYYGVFTANMHTDNPNHSGRQHHRRRRARRAACP